MNTLNTVKAIGKAAKVFTASASTARAAAPAAQPAASVSSSSSSSNAAAADTAQQSAAAQVRAHKEMLKKQQQHQLQKQREDEEKARKAEKERIQALQREEEAAAKSAAAAETAKAAAKAAASAEAAAADAKPPASTVASVAAVVLPPATAAATVPDVIARVEDVVEDEAAAPPPPKPAPQPRREHHTQPPPRRPATAPGASTAEVAASVAAAAVVTAMTSGFKMAAATAAAGGRTPLAIEAPPPRADIEIALDQDAIEMPAFSRDFRRLATIAENDPAGSGATQAAAAADAQDRMIAEMAEDEHLAELAASQTSHDGSKELKGTLKITLNQDFKNARKLVVHAQGRLLVDTDDCARSWIRGGAATMNISDKRADPIDKLVLRNSLVLWEAKDGDDSGLAMGTHTFPFSLKVSRVAPATVAARNFSITYMVKADFSTFEKSGFSVQTAPFTVYRTRPFREQALRSVAETEGKSWDSFVRYSATTPYDVLQSDKTTTIQVTIKTTEQVDFLKDVRATFKQATRIRFTALVEDPVTREVISRFIIIPLGEEGAANGSAAPSSPTIGSGNILSKFKDRFTRRSSSSSRSKSMDRAHIGNGNGTTSENGKVKEDPQPAAAPATAAGTAATTAVGDADVDATADDDDDGAEALNISAVNRVDANTYVVSITLPLAARNKTIAQLVHPDVIVPDVWLTHHVLPSKQQQPGARSAQDQAKIKMLAAASGITPVSAEKEKDKNKAAAAADDLSRRIAAASGLALDRTVEFSLPVAYMQHALAV
ncbi:hypothetical protein DFJ73DRAFT_800917 [Zopfochytrium polystomum]|nr:hypothetical protein DFJ73DRAFT_800917 [Zopfochytrium polystomum]